MFRKVYVEATPANCVAFYGPKGDSYKVLDERNIAMPWLWKIDATQWINPTHIVHIEDHPTWDPPLLVITMAIHAGKYEVTLTGEARERLLIYLVRETEPDAPQEPA